MWRRLRRRSMAPRRPVLFPEQYGLAFLTAVVLIAGLGIAVWAIVHSLSA